MGAAGHFLSAFTVYQAGDSSPEILPRRFLVASAQNANLKEALPQIATAIPSARDATARTGVEILIPSDTGNGLILPKTTVYKHTLVVAFEF
jgi:hypothetical protein